MKRVTIFALALFFVALGADHAYAAAPPFTQDLRAGTTSPDVAALQHYLDAHNFPLASSGPGSLGQETEYFGPLTRAALIAFQNANATNILAPLGLNAGTGLFFAMTRNLVNAQLAFAATHPVAVATSSPTVAVSTSSPTITSSSVSALSQAAAPVLALPYWLVPGFIGEETSRGSASAASPVAPTITFNAINETYQDGSFTLSATSNSSGAITYSSSDSTIVSVSGTTATINNIGSVTITASQAANGSYTSGSATATATITDQDECTPNPCDNGGTCARDIPGNFTCTCASGYSGTTCDDSSGPPGPPPPAF